MEGGSFNQPPMAEKPKEKNKFTKMTIICSWCKKVMGEKEVESANEEVTHSICDECKVGLKEEVKEAKKKREQAK